MGAVRLRNVTSDVVVSVREEKAASMGSEWEPADEVKKPPAKKAAARKTSD